MLLKKGIQVKVISGKDKGKTGEILEINRRYNKVKIKSIGIIKRHLKPTKENKGGIISKESFIHQSNVKNIDVKINDKKNMQLWNRFTAATVFGGCFFMLIWVKMFTLGLLGLYLSTLIPLYFSGDLKQLKIWATDPDAMDLATVPLWWLIGLSFLMLWIIIAMLLF